MAVFTSKHPAKAVQSNPGTMLIPVRIAGPDSLGAFYNGIQEQYDHDVTSLTIGGRQMKLTEHGTFLDIPLHPIALDSHKKYVTIAADGSVTVRTTKPQWYAPFRYPPAESHTPKVIVSPE